MTILDYIAMEVLPHIIINEILPENLYHQINGRSGELEIETESYWIGFIYNVEDYDVDKADREVGIMYDTILPTKTEIIITKITECGEDVETDNSEIEKYISQNIELDVYDNSKF